MIPEIRPGARGADSVRVPLIPDSTKEKIAKVALVAFISLAAFVFLPADAAVAITAIAILVGVISLTNCVIIPIERRSRPFFGFFPSFFRSPSPAPVHSTIRAYGPYPTHRAVPSPRPAAVVAGVSVAQPGPRVVVGSQLPGARAVLPSTPADVPRPPGGPAPLGTLRAPVGRRNE